MRCPARDKELTHHLRTNHAGLTISFFHCDGCDGYWTSGFDANYIDHIDEPSSQPKQSIKKSSHFVCAQCRQNLEIVRDDVVPPDVTIYTCRQGHGYFFPNGQLAKFKKAQEAKISYHKLWHIPLPPLHSVLLASIIIFLGISGVTILTKVNQTQTTQSQAKDVISFQQIIVSSADHTLLFLVRTNEKTTLTLHLVRLKITKQLMTSDGLSHTLLIKENRSGTYSYFYEYDSNGRNIRSKTYTLTVP